MPISLEAEIAKNEQHKIRVKTCAVIFSQTDRHPVKVKFNEKCIHIDPENRGIK